MPENFWESYGEGEITFLPVDDLDTGGSVAMQVLDTYGLSYKGTGGGELRGVDIKQMAALEAIKLSLLEEAAKTGVLKELVVNPYGELEFIEVGEKLLSLHDIYMSIQNKGLVLSKEPHVFVRGKTPLPVRTHRPWYNLLSDAIIWDTSTVTETCYSDYYKTTALITYPDPHLESTGYEDGVDGIFNPEDPNTQVAGWAYYLDTSEAPVGQDTTINVVKNVTVPITLGGGKIGKLQKRKTSVYGDEELCLRKKTVEANKDGAVRVPLPDTLRYENIRGTRVDKFRAVESVYVIGTELSTINVNPKGAASAKDTSQYDVWGVITNSARVVRRLTSGEEYVVIYDTEEGAIYIKFANNAPFGIPADFGDGTKLNFIAHSLPYEGPPTTDDLYSIFPVVGSDGTLGGLIVEDVIINVSLDSPGIVIDDPSGNALEIAQSLSFHISAITITKGQAPLAYNGFLVDQTSGVIDSDPTTIQPLEDTEYERIIKNIKSGSTFNVTISTLDDDETKQLSYILYDELKKDLNRPTTTHTFGPKAKIELGASGPTGGIVNSISYSYNDSSSYTISVTEGKYIDGGFGSITGGPYMKQTETFSGEGTVIQDYGNGVLYKVLIDRLGVRDAINGVAAPIKVGDKVGVTVYSNPVEG